MTYNYLIYTLNRFKPRLCAKKNDEFHVQGVQLIETQYVLDGEVYYNPDFLFLGRASELPPDPRKAPHDAVIIEDAPLPEGYEGSDALNLVLVDGLSDMLDLYNCVVFNVSDDTRTLNHALFFEQLDSEGLSPATILNLAYARLHNPLFLVSPEGRVIAYANSARVMGNEILRAVRRGKLDEALMREIFETDIYRLYTEQGMMYYKDQFPPGKYAMLPVGAHGFTIAYLITQNSETMFFNSDFFFMEKLRDLLSETMARQAQLYSDEGLMHSALFVDLISSEERDRASFEEQIDFLGWQFTDSMYLLTVELRAGAAAALTASFKGTFPGCRYLVYGDELLFLLSVPDEEYPFALDDLRRLLKSADTSGALSGRFSDPLAMRARYRQLRHMLALAEKLRSRAGQSGSGAGTLLTYDKYAPYFIAEAAHDRLSPSDYIPHGFGELVDYDERHSAGLIDTLELYLKYGGLPQEAITELCVSKSTAYYRLGKIRELCRVDLENGSTRAQLTVAVCAWRLYGREMARVGKADAFNCEPLRWVRS